MHSLELTLLDYLILAFPCLWAILHLWRTGDDANYFCLWTLWWRDNPHPMVPKSSHPESDLHNLQVHANIPAYIGVCSLHFPLNWLECLPSSLTQLTSSGSCLPPADCMSAWESQFFLWSTLFFNIGHGCHFPVVLCWDPWGGTVTAGGSVSHPDLLGT